MTELAVRLLILATYVAEAVGVALIVLGMVMLVLSGPADESTRENGEVNE